jgi:hypothetical protein
MANYFTLCGYHEKKKSGVSNGDTYLVFLTDAIRKIDVRSLLLELTSTLPHYSIIMEGDYADFQTVEIHANLFPNTLDYSDTEIQIWDSCKQVLLDTSHKKILDVCSRAEQSFMSCSACVEMQEEADTPSNTGCILHTLIPQKTNFCFNPKNYENRKIAGFDWVNPKWSTPNEFSSYYRPLHEHDFSIVGERKEIIQQQTAQATQTRTHGILRKKTVCPKCIVRSGCEKSRLRNEFNRCYHYYPDTIETNIKNATTTKLTIPQLSYILWFSGLVPFKIDKRKQWLTLYTTPKGELTPILHPVRVPYNTRKYLTWEETSELIDEIKKKSPVKRDYTLDNVPQVAMHKLALLSEACAISVSPTYRAPWHKTEYRTAYVSYGPYNAVIVHFSWPNVRQGRWELPWTLDLAELPDIYRYYRRFNYVQPTPIDFSAN